jgi:alpha-glucosidase
MAFSFPGPLRGLEQPHHDGSMVSTPAPAIGDTVTMWLRVPHASSVSSVHVRYVRDGEPAWVEGRLDRSDEQESWWRADLPVVNHVVRYRWLLQHPYRWVTQLGTCAFDVTDAADFRLVAYAAPPDWAMGAVTYQVFPDRFARDASVDTPWPGWAQPASWDDPVIVDGALAMTQLYGGNLAGLASKVGHLRSLSIGAVYTTPFFPARSNHRYDASSFDVVDPVLGGDAALARCVATLQAAGIRLIGDLTTNHCGAGHEWFRRAQADRSSPEYGFFRFRRHPDDYECWFGVPSLPKFDYANEGLADRLVRGSGSVVARWIRAGLAGWRVDVANMTGRLGTDDRLHDVARMFRKTLAETDPDAFVVAEHAHDATGDLEGDGWYSTMNYAGFTNPVWSWLGQPFGPTFFGMPAPLPSHDGRSVAATIDAVAAAVSWRTRIANYNLLGSHDTPRFRSVVGDRADLHEAGLALLATIPGSPMIFQGDELGMTGVHTHLSRSPIPWDRPELIDADTLARYRRLMSLRAAHPSLRTGGFRWASVGADHLCFLRESADERLLCAVSRTGAALPLDVRGDRIAGGLDVGSSRGAASRSTPSEAAFGIWQLS